MRYARIKVRYVISILSILQMPDYNALDIVSRYEHSRKPFDENLAVKLVNPLRISKC